MKKILALLGIVIALTGCQSVKEKASTMADFFDALGSGDLKFLKKHKKEVEDGSWEEVDNEK
jgi:hypothetical protein